METRTVIDKQLAKNIAEFLSKFHIDPEVQNVWLNFGKVVDQLTQPIQLPAPQRDDLASKLAAEFMKVPIEDLESVLKFGFSFWILQSEQGPFRVEKVLMMGDRPYDPDFTQMERVERTLIRFQERRAAKKKNGGAS